MYLLGFLHATLLLQSGSLSDVLTRTDALHAPVCPILSLESAAPLPFGMPAIARGQVVVGSRESIAQVSRKSGRDRTQTRSPTCLDLPLRSCMLKKSL